MEKVELRPRHSMEVPISVEESIKRIEKGVELSNGDILIKVRNSNIKLEIADKDKHYWSPELNINVDPTEDGKGSVVHGVCGPRQSIWLMFTFFYGFLIFGIFIVAIFGFSRKSLGQTSTILYLMPVLIVTILAMYITSKYGQKLAYDQMYQLRKLVKRAIKDNNVDKSKSA